MATRLPRSRLLTLCALVLVAWAADAHGQAGGLVPGTYRCSSYNVSGGGGSCRNTPPLVLSADGSYRHSSTQGRWVVRDAALHLSESRLWGSGTVLGPNMVRFEYDYSGWHHVVTWRCPDCASQSGAASVAPDAAPRAPYVGVSLLLEFGTPVGGVSTFTIVPAESAGGYRHNSPLPAGSAQGIAWEKSRTTIGLTTNRDTKLLAGKRYVVFLSWPRETIPVAILDLPATGGDYAATIPATLDGGRVLDTQRLSPTPPAPSARRPIGVEITDVTPAIAEAVGEPSLKGAGVVRVAAGGPASRAGVRAGDIITAVNGVAIGSASEGAALLARRSPGEGARLMLFRAGRVLELRLTDD